MNIPKSGLLIVVLSIVAALLLLLSIFSLYNFGQQTRTLADNNRAFTVCMTNWASATTERNRTLTTLNSNRNQKLDTVIRDVAIAQKKPSVHIQQKFITDIDAYVVASDRYNKALKKHPIPKSPKLICANDKK